MIKRFATINDFAVFKQFDWGKAVLSDKNKPVDFEKINIIYGRNYSGKTTLSRILRSFEMHESPDPERNPQFSILLDGGRSINETNIFANDICIRVFNEDFVHTNFKFFLDPTNGIRSFAVLGKNNTQIEEEISKIQKELGNNTEGQKTGLYKELDSIVQDATSKEEIYNKASKALDTCCSNEAIGREKGIKYQPDKFGDQNYNTAKLQSEIDLVTASEPSRYVPLTNDQVRAKERLLDEKAKGLIASLPSIQLHFGQLCDDSAKLLGKEIGSSNKIVELLKDVALNQWVKEGYKLHKDKRERCAFCGNEITDERWKQLYSHFDEESRELENEIDSLCKEIDVEQKQIEGITTFKDAFYTEYQVSFDSWKKSFEEQKSLYVDGLTKIKEQLETRKGNITVASHLIRPNDESQELVHTLVEYEDLRNKSNGFTNKLSSTQQEAKRALRLDEVWKFCKMIQYEERKQEIKKKKEESEAAQENCERIRLEIKDKEKSIHEKSASQKDEGKAAGIISNYLKEYFGHKFLSLEPIRDSDKSVHFEVMREGERAYHLSEGECDLISMCYFIAKLNDVDTSNKKPIIWIDDPISSLDENHIFFMYSLLLNEIEKKANFEQLFVSTHNLDFLKYLQGLPKEVYMEDGQKISMKQQLFVVVRTGNTSTLHVMPLYLSDYGTEFNYLFSCIYKCANSPIEDRTLETFYNFANNARKFLEIYLYFRYPDPSLHKRQKYEKFFGKDTIGCQIIDRLNNEYSHLKSLERAERPINIPEIKEVANKIIEKIKQEDPEQYEAFLSALSHDSLFATRTSGRDRTSL